MEAKPQKNADQLSLSLFSQVEPPSARKLTQQQQQYLEAFTSQYTKRTQKSQQQAQANHQFLADKRYSIGFRWETRKMIYPIVAERSLGAKFWDIDGNEYVDLTMGFGVHFFGHGAPFITASLENEIKQGLQIGPQSKIAGEVGRLIC